MAGLTQEQIQEELAGLPGWSIEDGKLTRDLKVKNFREALDLVNRIGELSEEANHHPDISIYSWNRVRIQLYTHTIQALSENDFMMARKFQEFLPASDG